MAKRLRVKGEDVRLDYPDDVAHLQRILGAAGYVVSDLDQATAREMLAR